MRRSVPFIIWLPLLLAGLAGVSIATFNTFSLIDEPYAPAVSIKTKAIRIAVTGDIACSPDSPSFNEGKGTAIECRHADIAALIASQNVDAVLLAGDIQYDKGEAIGFEKSFLPVFGKLTKPIYAVPGNHDYSNEDHTAAAYFNAINDLLKDGYGGEVNKGYYSLDIGAWRLFALNSNCEYIGGCNEGSPQYEWLKTSLSEKNTTCSVAMWHHPVFTSGRHKEGESINRGKSFWKLLDESGVDVILNGHDHNYERFMPQNVDGQPTADGTREFVSGAGGRSLYKTVQPSLASSEKAVDDTFGVLFLTLRKKSYGWQYIAIDGTTKDAGVAACGI